MSAWKIALSLAAAGCYVFPIRADNGKPRVKWGDGATADREQIRTWWKRHSDDRIGIHCGRSGLVVVDRDRHGEKDGFASMQAAGLTLPETFGYTSRSGNGRHDWFAAPDGADLTIGADVLGMPGVDVRAGVGFVAYNGPRLDGRPELAPAPAWALLKPGGGGREVATNDDVEAWLSREVKRKPSAETRALVRAIPTDGAGNHDLLPLLRPVVVSLLDRRGRRGAIDEARERYAGGHGHDAERAFDRALGKLVAAMPSDLTVTFDAPPIASKPKREATATATTTKGQQMTDGDLDVRHDADRAEMIAADLRGELLYVDGQSLHMWDGKRWAARGDAYAIERVRRWHEDYARSAIGSDLRGTDLAKLLSRSSIAASEALLRGILAVRADQMDAHPDLLNAGNGVVDLRTGELLEHDPALLMTKIASADYRPGARHRDWDTALQALPPDVADWLRVRFGQAITGWLVSDDKLVVLHGGGENGKGVMLNGVMRAAGDYAALLPHKLLLGSPSDHTTELTTLQGLRLGFLEELPEGRRLDVVRLKSVFGTEHVTARRMRQDNVTFAATHSVFVTTNYRPEVPEVDHGTWRRLTLVEFPYTYKINPDPSLGEMPADPGLRSRMKHATGARAAAVLAWLIDGAREWYAREQQFPAPPVEVEESTRQWRASSDVISAFADDALTFEPDGFASARELHARFAGFLAARGQREWSETLFVGRFEAHELSRSLRKDRRRIDGKQVSGWWGVALTPNQTVIEGWSKP